MRLLLDTHAFLWAVGRPDSLDPEARDAITDPANLVLLSAVTPWEIAIKRALGKLIFEGSVSEHAAANRFTPLPITLGHAEGVEALPALHGDPFDRLLVSQALAEDATIVTRDPAVAAYEVPVLPA
jgi:PIN domain nuclease of toxin-antitoxin system